MKCFIILILSISLTSTEEITSWDDLKLDYTERFNDSIGLYMLEPKFNDSIKQLEGKTITVKGYFQSNIDAIMEKPMLWSSCYSDMSTSIQVNNLDALLGLSDSFNYAGTATIKGIIHLTHSIDSLPLYFTEAEVIDKEITYASGLTKKEMKKRIKEVNRK